MGATGMSVVPLLSKVRSRGPPELVAAVTTAAENPKRDDFEDARRHTRACRPNSANVILGVTFPGSLRRRPKTAIWTM